VERRFAARRVQVALMPVMMLVAMLTFRRHRIGGAHRTVGLHRRALCKRKRHGDGHFDQYQLITSQY